MDDFGIKKCYQLRSFTNTTALTTISAMVKMPAKFFMAVIDYPKNAIPATGIRTNCSPDPT